MQDVAPVGQRMSANGGSLSGRTAFQRVTTIFKSKSQAPLLRLSPTICLKPVFCLGDRRSSTPSSFFDSAGQRMCSHSDIRHLNGLITWHMRKRHLLGGSLAVPIILASWRFASWSRRPKLPANMSSDASPKRVNVDELDLEQIIEGLEHGDFSSLDLVKVSSCQDVSRHGAA